MEKKTANAQFYKYLELFVVFMEKIVLLLSGGLDSSLLLSILSKQDLQVLPLFIDYGQRNRNQELRAATYMSKLFNCNLHKYKVGLIFENSLLIKGSSSQSPFLPHRNLLFLVLGAVYAFNNKCNAVAIGLIGGSNYPDSNSMFVQQASKSIAESIGKEVIVHAPFIDLTKSDIAYLAHLVKLPIEKTYSCYMGEPKHCQECSACIQRFDSLREIEENV